VEVLEIVTEINSEFLSGLSGWIWVRYCVSNYHDIVILFAAPAMNHEISRFVIKYIPRLFYNDPNPRFTATIVEKEMIESVEELGR